MKTKKNWKWKECTEKYYTNPKQKKATLLSVKENLKTIKISRNEKRHFKMKKETKDFRDNTIINLCAPKKISWTRKWQPIPVFLPRKFYWQRSYSPWGCKESDITERLHFHFPLPNPPFLTKHQELFCKSINRIMFLPCPEPCSDFLAHWE